MGGSKEHFILVYKFDVSIYSYKLNLLLEASVCYVITFMHGMARCVTTT